MARRRGSSEPSLGLLGTAPVVAQIAVAATQLGWPVRSARDADLAYVGAGSTNDELAEVLNTRPGKLRTVVRRLGSMGVVERSALPGAYRIVSAWLPATERLLRQKHFLYA